MTLWIILMSLFFCGIFVMLSTMEDRHLAKAGRFIFLGLAFVCGLFAAAKVGYWLGEMTWTNHSLSQETR